MRVTRPFIPFAILALLTVALLAPSIVEDVHASGCTTNCYLTANTNVPASDATIWVRLDNTTLYTLPRTFAFANGTIHTIQALNLTFKVSSGTRYVWRQGWTLCGNQYDPNPMMRTPRMLANYTSTCPFTGPFVAQYDIIPPAGCTTNCLLEAKTSVPATEATIWVRLDNTTTYALPQTFSFPNGTRHSIEVLNSTVRGVSGAYYVWRQWTQGANQYPAQMLHTPPMIYNYTTGFNGPFTAQLDKVYSATIRVLDKNNNPAVGATVTVTFANSTVRSFTTDGQGSVQLGLIPPGSYAAHITYQNQDMGIWTADPSQTPTFTIVLSTGGSPIVSQTSIVVILTIFGLAAFLAVLAIQTHRPPRPPRI